jgi:hypothetical protein
MTNPNDPQPPSPPPKYSTVDHDAVTKLERFEAIGHSALTPTGPRAPLPPSVPPPRIGSSHTVLKMALAAVAGLLTVMLAAALTVLLSTRSGELVVNVSGAGGEAIEGLSIQVDGEQRCTKVPCRLAGISPGAHGVKADGHGYAATAERHVLVEAGRQALLDLVLAPDPGTGVRVTAKGADFRLSVDGREIGSVPREVGSLAPGEHTLKIVGNPSFAAFEQKVLVPAGQMVDVELVPPVVEGMLSVEPGEDANGAAVYLQIGDERRRLAWRKPVPVRADAQAIVVATKQGYDDFAQPVQFVPGEAELVMMISLVKQGKEPGEEPPPAVVASRAPRAKVAGTARKAAPVEDDATREEAVLSAEPYSGGPKPAPAAGGATGKVSVNSIPASNVTLNGRDIGQTPKMGIEVPAGPVTAVFKHPELGTMTRSAVVKAGGSVTLVVKFKQP